MHDWTLLSIFFDWRAARVTLSFRRPGGNAATITADGATRLDVPRYNEWGPSVSVNRVALGPMHTEEGGRETRRLAIEMQSGDVIEVSAAVFALPPHALGEAAPLEDARAGK